MMRFAKGLIVVAALLSGACAAQAQSTTPATGVTIDDAAWLTGRWVGEGLGGQMEEVWSAPAGGQMVGHFRLVRNGAPSFYEFILLDVADGGLRMRLKHFNPDHTAWEERNDWVTFTPVSSSPTEIVFSALTIRRDGLDAMTMLLRLRNGDALTEHTLNFRRAPT